MELVMDRWQRRVVFVGWPLVIVALVALPLLLVGDHLPDPLATRFHPGGEATGSTPFATWVVVQVVIALLCSTALVRNGRRPTPDTPVIAAVASFIGLFVGWIGWSIAFANEGHDDWHEVTLGAGAIAGALGSAMGCTIPVVLMARRIAPARPPHPSAAIPFGPDEHPAWFGHTRSIGFAVAGAANVALGIVVALMSDAAVGALLAVIGLLLASFASVVVIIDERGVGVRSGLLGWPRLRLPLGLIEEAEPTDVRPLRFGGLGYRGSLRLFRAAAWVLRAGEGLQLQLRGGQRFTVSIDDADEAAAVLNGLVARAATPRTA
jgi:hypothetical protein